MLKNKNFLTITGFLLLMIGASSLILSLVGVKFAFLTWIDAPSPLFGVVAKFVMVIMGIVMAALANTNWEQENEL